MASGVSKKIKDVIRDEVAKQSILGSELSSEEFIPPRITEHQFGEEKISGEEKVIDELLASVPRNQGYYLKLYKELRPNDWELKQRIDSFETWSDLEWEIASIVRAYTLKVPTKWGSGRYRIVIWRDGGLRGPKFKPIDFWVDAGESENPNQNAQVEGVSTSEKVKDQLQTLGELINVLKSANPTTSPAEMQKLLFDAFKSGADAKTAERTVETAQQANVMQLLIPILSELIRSKTNDQAPNALTGLVNELMKEVISKKSFGEKSALETLKELKEAGLIPQSVQPVNTDPMETVKKQIELFAAMIPLIQNLTGGGGGNSSIGAEIVRTVGPQIKDIVRDITGAVNKVAEAKIAEVQIRRPKNVTPQSQPSQEMIEPTASTNGRTLTNPPQSVSPDLPSIFKPLKDAIEYRNHKYFPELEELLLRYGNETYQLLLDEKVTLEAVLENIKPISGDWIISPEAKVYFQEYLNWAKQKKLEEIIVKCIVCNSEYIFDSKEVFDQAIVEGVKCEHCSGTLEVVNNE